MRAVIAAANFLWCSIAAESARVLSAAEGQIRALELEAAEAKREDAILTHHETLDAQVSCRLPCGKQNGSC
jgi:hypothetical protein